MKSAAKFARMEQEKEGSGRSGRHFASAVPFEFGIPIDTGLRSSALLPLCLRFVLRRGRWEEREREGRRERERGKAKEGEKGGGRESERKRKRE